VLLLHGVILIGRCHYRLCAGLFCVPCSVIAWFALCRIVIDCAACCFLFLVKKFD